MDSGEDKAFFEELKREFLVEATFLLDQGEESYLALEDEGTRKEALDSTFRIYHSIKGGAAAVGLEDLSAFSHGVENMLAILRADPDAVNTEATNLLFQAGDALRKRIDNLRKGKEVVWDVQELLNKIESVSRALQTRTEKTEDHPHTITVESDPEQQKTTKTTVRVSTRTIDSVLDLIGELVVIKSQLLHGKIFSGKKTLGLDSLLTLFDKTVRELQDKALHMRMTPLKTVFMRAQRQVRELSLQLNKPTQIVVKGDGTEIDRDLIELLSDPLLHLIRNAIDHGIEDEATRKKKRKDPQATITLSAKQVRGRIEIEIQDDGGGIDRKRVIERAHDRGVLEKDVTGDTLSDHEVYDLLFLPGFSTREEISDISGRGVGLDVVKSNIEKIKGLIEVESVSGEGTTFRLSIPLTAAIFDGMVVLVGDNYFILPLDKIVEIIDCRKVETLVAGGQEFVSLRDDLVSLIDLREAFKGVGPINETDPDEKKPIAMSEVTVVVQYYNQKLALHVNAVVGQVQVVVKPLGKRFEEVPDVSGAAILGDGKIALIVDTDGIGRRFSVPTSKSIRGINSADSAANY